MAYTIEYLLSQQLKLPSEFWFLFQFNKYEFDTLSSQPTDLTR